jgi:hypothetical protein
MADQHDIWMQGLGLNIGQLRQATSTQTSSATPAAASAKDGRGTQDIADRIVKKIKADSDLGAEFSLLSHLDMRNLLDVMARLKKAGALEDFADRVTTNDRRLGAALLTMRPDLEAQWQALVIKLDDDDRKIILERVPADARAKLGTSATTPAAPGRSEPAVDTDAVLAVGPGGAEVQAKLTFHSSLAGNLGETEFTVHIGPDGKLSQFELDVTALKAKIEKLGALAPMLELEATLSLNSTTDLDQKATQLVFKAVQVQAKGEIEAHFKTIKAFEKVAFKLTATAGSGGFSVTGSIEIEIPGT